MAVLPLDVKLGTLQMQHFAIQIGAVGAFCSDVGYKMPVNVCEIVLWF